MTLDNGEPSRRPGLGEGSLVSGRFVRMPEDLRAMEASISRESLGQRFTGGTCGHLSPLYVKFAPG